MAAYAPRTLALSDTELQSLQALTGLPRESFEHCITRDNLHRWTLAQLKSITVALSSRLPPRFALRGAKAAQVAQLAAALFEPPPPRAAPPAAASPTPRVAVPAAPLSQSVMSPYQGSSLSSAEKEMIKGALHPFYEEISIVAVSRVSALRLANSSHHQLRFQIDPQMLTQLESQSGTYGLLIRFFKDVNDIQWWNDFHVILNGKTVDTRSLQKKIRTNPKYQSFVTPYPADIGTKVNSGTNMVEFYYHNWATTAILVIDFVKKRKQTDLMALVPLHKGAVSFASTGRDEDLEELKQKLPLTCPITMGRMVHPAKGRHCSHIHGFDLGTYLSFCNQAQVWNCPICQKPLPFNQLVRDELITNILAATGEEVASVELDSNGKWSLGNESIPIDAGEDSDGEANAKRSRSSDANLSARKAPRIDSMLRAAAAPSPSGSNGSMSVPAAATPGRGETVIVVS